MRPDKPKPTKSELLAELESIRYSLSDEELEQLMQQEDCEIPVLVEPVSVNEEAATAVTVSDEEADITLTAVDAVSEDDLVFDDSGPRTRTETTVTYPSRTYLSHDDTANDDEPSDNAFFPGALVPDELTPTTFTPNKRDEHGNPRTHGGVSETSVVFSSAEPDSPETTIAMDDKSDLLEPSLGQQSLFDQPASTQQKKNTRPEKSKPKASPVVADEENPFLPKHIRDRLSRGRSTIMDELMQVGDSLNRDKSQFQYSPADTEIETTTASATPAPPAPLPHPSKQTDRIVDELVAEYLPRLEAELRKRLREQLSTAGKHTTADSETSS